MELEFDVRWKKKAMFFRKTNGRNEERKLFDLPDMREFLAGLKLIAADFFSVNGRKLQMRINKVILICTNFGRVEANNTNNVCRGDSIP